MVLRVDWPPQGGQTLELLLSEDCWTKMAIPLMYLMPQLRWLELYILCFHKINMSQILKAKGTGYFLRPVRKRDFRECSTLSLWCGETFQ